MSWIVTLVIGGIVGWLASIVMKTNAQMGLIANILVGVVGSLIGYWVAGQLGVTTQGGIVGFLIAIAGAIVLIFILQKLGLSGKPERPLLVPASCAGTRRKIPPVAGIPR